VDRAFEKINILANVVEEGASRTARIVSDMKTFSHPGNEVLAPFDLHGTLDMCLNLLSNQIRGRVKIFRDYQADKMVVGPRGQLGQVFMNLLNNAQQAIDGEGEIHVETSQDERFAEVRFRDTGHGIPPEIVNRIFDPFFTTKEPGVGTGLGLSISYGIVSRIGGSIRCHSDEGSGTEFTIQLPRSVDAAADPQALCLVGSDAVT